MMEAAQVPLFQAGSDPGGEKIHRRPPKLVKGCLDRDFTMVPVGTLHDGPCK